MRSKTKKTKKKTITEKPKKAVSDKEISNACYVINEDFDERLEELQEALKIDQAALDEMILYQAVLYEEVSSRLAYVTSMRDAAKQTLQLVEAKTYRLLRKSLTSNQKITEKELEYRVRSSSSVIEATQEYLDLGHKVGKWTALKESFQQRSYMIRELAQLQLSHFFGTNSISSRDKDQDAAVVKAHRKKLREHNRG